MTEALIGMHIEVKFWGYKFDTLFVSLRDI